MTPEGVAAYLETSTGVYVAELIESGMEPEAAQKNADDVMAESFPGGEVAEGNEIYDVVSGDEPVGILWLAKQGQETWWIFDIEMHEDQRGKGYGRATMLLAENRVRELGGTAMGLHVFGANTTARALYDSLGYEPTNIRMRKSL
jgi:ribosomal protein S18 acetylase RimI-like enzyme